MLVPLRFLPALPFLGLLAAPVPAHDEPASTFDRVNYQVSAAREVENDTLVAVMYHERSGQQASAMADDVNRTIAWAVDLARKNDAVQVQTLNYRQDPLYKNQAVVGWKVRQSIRLESTDVGALGELIGALQSRLSVASLSYTISRGARMRVEDELIAEALARFRARGELMAGELGRPGYRIVNLDVNTGGTAPVPVRMHAMAAMAESSSVAPPTLEAGVQTVTVQVSGTIELEVPR